MSLFTCTRCQWQESGEKTVNPLKTIVFIQFFPGSYYRLFYFDSKWQTKPTQKWLASSSFLHLLTFFKNNISTRSQKSESAILSILNSICCKLPKFKTDLLYSRTLSTDFLFSDYRKFKFLLERFRKAAWTKAKQEKKIATLFTKRKKKSSDAKQFYTVYVL